MGGSSWVVTGCGALAGCSLREVRDHCDADHALGVLRLGLVVAGEPPVHREPVEAAFYYPASWDDREAFGLGVPWHDVDIDALGGAMFATATSSSARTGSRPSARWSSAPLATSCSCTCPASTAPRTSGRAGHHGPTCPSTVPSISPPSPPNSKAVHAKRSAGKPQPSACINCSRPDQHNRVLQRPLETALPVRAPRHAGGIFPDPDPSRNWGVVPPDGLNLCARPAIGSLSCPCPGGGCGPCSWCRPRREANQRS